MKTSTFATILVSLLFPIFPFAAAAHGAVAIGGEGDNARQIGERAGGPITLTSLVDGFVITGEEDSVPVGGTISKGFWDGQILKHGGQIIVSASTGSARISQAVEHVFPSISSPNVYGYGIALDANALRSTTDMPPRVMPLTVRVEARNANGVVIAYDEARGALMEKATSPALTVSLAPITPPSVSYERGNTWQNFSVITFAAERENVGILQLTLTRNGGNDNDLLNIQLFDGTTRLGMADRFQDGRIVIPIDSPFVIPKGSWKYLTIKADVDQNADVYSIDNGIAVGIANLSDIQAIGMETGNFIMPANFAPVFGNPMGIH